MAFSCTVPICMTRLSSRFAGQRSLNQGLSDFIFMESLKLVKSLSHPGLSRLLVHLLYFVVISLDCLLICNASGPWNLHESYEFCFLKRCLAISVACITVQFHKYLDTSYGLRLKCATCDTSAHPASSCIGIRAPSHWV